MINEHCFKKYGICLSDSIIKLNPTGRWMIKYEDDLFQYYLQNTSGLVGDRKLAKILYIEHQGRFFKRWINEDDIINGFAHTRKFVNKCNSK